MLPRVSLPIYRLEPLRDRPEFRKVLEAPYETTRVKVLRIRLGVFPIDLTKIMLYARQCMATPTINFNATATIHLSCIVNFRNALENP